MSVHQIQVDPAKAQGWYDAVGRGELVTAEQRNALAVVLGAQCDLLADPVHALSVTTGTVQLPEVPYQGPDRTLTARNARVALVGAVPPPAHWLTGAERPSADPDWVRATDAERRVLYGATRELLARLARTGDVNPATGTARASGWLLAAGLVTVAVVGYVYVATRAVDRVGDVATTRVREDAATARYALLLKQLLEEYKLRLEALRVTGTMPPPSPTAQAAATTPYNATTGQTVPQAGEDWWTRAKAAAPWVVGGAGVVVVGLAAVAYALRQASGKGDRGGYARR